MLRSIIFFLASIAIAGMITALITPDNTLPLKTAFFGSLFFFGGEHMTGSGFFSGRLTYVSKPTPVPVWKLAGIILWVLAAVFMILGIGRG